MVVYRLIVNLGIESLSRIERGFLSIEKQLRSIIKENVLRIENRVRFK